MIGQNIKYLRNKFKLSQQELSEKLSVPRSSLSDYERGHTQVGIETLIKLADIFDVKIDDILRSNLSHRDLEIIRNKDLRVLAISVDVDNNSNIELVETKAEAEARRSSQRGTSFFTSDKDEDLYDPSRGNRGGFFDA